MQDEMLNEFLIEVDELFVEAEDSLLAIEKLKNFNGNYNSIFRSGLKSILKQKKYYKLQCSYKAKL